MHARPADRPDLTGGDAVRRTLDRLFRREAGRLTASLARIFGVAQLQLVEDVVQEALLEALRRWRFHGVPDNPHAWLRQVARNRAIDEIRRRTLAGRKERELALWNERRAVSDPAEAESGPDEMDEQLRLMFACCDPRIPGTSRIALTLKSLCGFGVPEIARALLSSPESVAQRLVRAKRLLRDDRVALCVPPPGELAKRLESLLQTLYLMFNEGYLTHRGDAPIRRDLIEEATRLAILLLKDPRTAQPESHALLALMLFHGARVDSRTSADGSLILLPDQDRSLWDRSLIQRGYHHLRLSMAGEEATAFHLEAGIAAVHARASAFEETNWPEILGLYDLLAAVKPSPVVELNRAVAVAMARGPEAGLEALGLVQRDGRLDRYFLLHAVHGELLERAGRRDAAKAALGRALELPCTEPERRLIESRIERLQGPPE